MMLLVSGATKTVARIRDPRLGQFFRPGNGNLPGALPWGADNGAFTGKTTDADWCGFLERIKGRPGAFFVAAPDVPYDSAATLAKFAIWEPLLHADGFPVALVSQDGLTPEATPWDSLEALFVGGTDAHKLGAEAHALIAEARRRRKHVHVGRVNSERRLRYAIDVGADSVDGSSFSRFPDTWIPWALRKMGNLEAQGRLA